MPVRVSMGGCHGTWHVLHEGCRESPACYYAAMTGPIGLKLGMQVGTHKIIRVRVSRVRCYSTCARAWEELSHPVQPRSSHAHKGVLLV